MAARQYSLVADIGGTNARFALVDGGRPVEPRNLSVADHATIVDAIKTYLQQVGLSELHQAAISLASPVTGDRLHMTNHTWSFSVAEAREALGLARLKVLNDYTALALALPFLADDECLQVGPGERRPGHPLAVLGPGTGLGVSGAIPADDHWLPLASEGGHVSYGPATEREAAIIAVLRERMQHVSAESLVSGPGLTHIYAALTRLDRGTPEKLSPGQITDLALKEQCALAAEALSIFCAILGTVGGNLALTLGARGGVFVGGGIVLRILDFFTRSDFRARFESHGRLSGYLRAIPTYVINTDYPALLGAAVALGDAYEEVGVSSHAGATT